MVIVFTKEAEKDLKHWKKNNNKDIQMRISELLSDIKDNPYNGIGNQEPLKHELSGFWSRRINKEHRLGYRVQDDKIDVISLRFHY